MSAGFSVGDQVFWGSNGAVESYVEVMAAEAAERLGPDDPLAVFLRDERAQFFMGKVVFLDDWTADISRRRQLVELLDAAIHYLMHLEVFTDHGREWAASVMAELRGRLADEDRPKRDD